MRITCPNCGAQYEVPADVMPTEGRDVQCSNCGTTWFQEHPDHVDALTSQAAQAPEYDEELETFTEPEVEESAGLADTPPDMPDVRPAPAPPDPEVEAAPKRRELDPAVANVLRAEAELEEQARRNEAVAMESQPELGLESATADAKKRAREARDRMARMRGETTPTEPATDGPAVTESSGSRRDLLPDIEEINSTLRSNSDRSPETDPGQTAQYEVQEQRSSRRGFALTVLLVAILSLVYVFAPDLAEKIPAVAGPLDSYVAVINSWRGWIDSQVVAMLSWLDAAAASSAGQ